MAKVSKYHSLGMSGVYRPNVSYSSTLKSGNLNWKFNELSSYIGIYVNICFSKMSTYHDLTNYYNTSGNSTQICMNDSTDQVSIGIRKCVIFSSLINIYHISLKEGHNIYINNGKINQVFNLTSKF